MSIIELFIMAVGLAMDAFAVSICKGLATKKVQIKHYLLVAVWFGGFQALMPAIGYNVGKVFSDKVSAVAPWITFAVLGLIGGNMIREAIKGEEDDESDSFKFMTMLMLAIATSIDALAVGVTFAMQKGTNVIAAVTMIGIVTGIISAIGIKVGNIFGLKYQKRAQIAGGLILVVLGCKFLIQSFL